MQKILIAVALFAWSMSVAARPVSILVYQVWEKGIEPYISRVMVTPDYVRLDEGGSADGFTLFDRQQEILYTVSMEDRSVLVMNPTQSVPDGSSSLILQEEVKVDAEAPQVAGKQPKTVRLLANGETCSEMVVIEGVMDEAVEALGELKLTLARIQAATLDAVPLNMRTPCDLAANVYAADRSYRFGLPLSERSGGHSQSLIDFAPDHEAEGELFTLPEGFSRRAVFAPGAI